MRYGILAFWLLASCAPNPQKKGTVTISDRGAYGLTERGDMLLDTGVYAKKDVPEAFAEGYVKGQGDQVKRAYWAEQYRQWVLHLWVTTRKESPIRERN